MDSRNRGQMMSPNDLVGFHGDTFSSQGKEFEQ